MFSPVFSSILFIMHRLTIPCASFYDAVTYLHEFAQPFIAADFDNVEKAISFFENSLGAIGVQFKRKEKFCQGSQYGFEIECCGHSVSAFLCTFVEANGKISFSLIT